MFTTFFSRLGFLTFTVGCFWIYDQLFNQSSDSRDGDPYDYRKCRASYSYPGSSTFAREYAPQYRADVDDDDFDYDDDDDNNDDDDDDFYHSPYDDDGDNDGFYYSPYDDIDFFEPEPPKQVKCPECHGKKKIYCPECYGQSYIQCPECLGRGKDRDGDRCDPCMGTGNISCEYCNGYGRVECPQCNGDGMVDS